MRYDLGTWMSCCMNGIDFGRIFVVVDVCYFGSFKKMTECCVFAGKLLTGN